jgi:serine/threonine-protein kinase
MLILYFSLTVKVKNDEAIEPNSNKGVEKREVIPQPPKDAAVKANDKKIEAPVTEPAPEKKEEIKKETPPVEEKKEEPSVIDKLKDLAGAVIEQKQETPAGGLKVIAYPWAKVYVDGEYVETTPTSRIIKLPAGEHKITFSHPNFPSVTRKVNIKENETREIVVRLEPRQEKR